jgi:ribosomal protein S27E
METVEMSLDDPNGYDLAVQCNDCKKVVPQVWQWKGWRVLCWSCLKKAELWEEME